MYKKLLVSVLFTLTLAISFLSVNKTQAQAVDYINYVKFEIDGVSKYIPSILRDGITYVSVREIASTLGNATVSYNSGVTTISQNKNGRNFTATINTNKKKNNYITVKRKNPTKTETYGVTSRFPLNSNGKIYIAVPEINSIFNTNTAWNNTTKTLSFTYVGYNYIDGYNNVYMNDATAKSFYAMYKKRYQSDVNYYKKYNAIVELGNTIISKAYGARVISKIYEGTAKVTTNNKVQMKFLTMVHPDYVKLRNILESPSYQGRGIYFSIQSASPNALNNNVKQQ